MAEEIDDWEKEFEESAAAAPAFVPTAKATDKSAAKKAANKAALAKATASQAPVAADGDEDEAENDDAPLKDPVAEKLRQKRILEQADAALMDDLFAGCEKPAVSKTTPTSKPKAAKTIISVTGPADPFEAFKLVTQVDCEKLGEKLVAKIAASQAKSPGWLRFLDLVMQECVQKMEQKDVTTLANKLRIMSAEKEKNRKLEMENKKKPQDVKSVTRNWRDEVDMMYGGGDDDFDDYDDDDPAAGQEDDGFM